MTAQDLSLLDATVIPLTQSFFSKAESTAAVLGDLPHAQRVRQNALAVQAVNAYLRMLGFSVDLSRSTLWNPVIIALGVDIADLSVPGVGIVECRPVQPGSETCYIPPEVWEGRLAYLVVSIDEPEREATLLGLVKEANTEYIPLSQLQPFDEIFELLEPALKPQPWSTPLNLREWLKRYTVERVRAVQEFIESIQPTLSPDDNPGLSYAFRSATDEWEETNSNQALRLLNLWPEEEQLPNQATELLQIVNSTKDESLRRRVIHRLGSIAPDNADVHRCLAELALNAQNDETRWESILMLNVVEPHYLESLLGEGKFSQKMKRVSLGENQREIYFFLSMMHRRDESVSFQVQIQDVDPANRLPVDLKLIILDRNGQSQKEITSSVQDRKLQFRFSIRFGESFGIKLKLSSFEVVEGFDFY